MARKKKTSPAEDLLHVVALMPWWVGVLLAIASYLMLHSVATQPVASSAQPGQMGPMLAANLFKSLATFGQYIVPVICLAGAGISAWKRRARQTLLTSVVQSDAASVLDGMSWQQFEQLVGEAFRRRGYSVAETGGGGADGGVDLVLSKGTEKFLVQCKQWKAFKVGVDVVRELYGVMAAKGAAGGFVVTSGRFTADATAFAQGRNIELVDGPQLHEWIQKAGRPKAAAVAPHDKPAAPPPERALQVPGCPVCAQPMVKRVAKRGANAGGEFWGCTAYPACKGTKSTA